MSVFRSVAAEGGGMSTSNPFDWGGWVLALILSVMVSLVLGLTLVWFNIERMDMAYDLKKLQAEVDKRISLAAKLEVERDRLISPSILYNKAKEMEMRPAKSGQIRTLPAPAAE